MKKICPECEKVTEQNFVTRIVEFNVMGKTKVNIVVNGSICSECGEFLYDWEKALMDAYRIAEHITGEPVVSACKKAY